VDLIWAERECNKLVAVNPSVEIVLLYFSICWAKSLRLVVVVTKSTYMPIVGRAFHCIHFGTYHEKMKLQLVPVCKAAAAMVKDEQGLSNHLK
jgi:hypothetical protein